MPLRRFVGYFVALTVCSTIAFASCMTISQGTAEDSAESPVYTAAVSPAASPSLVHVPARHHAIPKISLVASAD